MRLGQVDVEIDPLPLRRDFELFVSADVLKIRTGKVAIVKRPVRMIIELLIALVETIGRSKKRDRVRYVNSHGHVQLATDVPHGIESRIIDLYEYAGSNVFSKIET